MNQQRRFYERYWKPSPEAVPQDLGWWDKPRQRLLCRVLQENRIGSVLEVGCGLGDFIPFFQGLGLSVTAVDISFTALFRAREHHPGNYVCASAEGLLPFADCSYDLIWCSEVLEHLFDVRATLREFNRCLRVGGLVALTVPYHGLVKNLVISLVGFQRHFDPYGGHIRFFTRKSLWRCLRDAAFQPLWSAGLGRMWPLYMSMFVVARKEAPCAS